MDLEELTDLRIDLGDGIYMRPVRSGDAAAALEVIERNYDHLRTFMEWAKPDYSLEDAEDWLLAQQQRETATTRTLISAFSVGPE